MLKNGYICDMKISITYNFPDGKGHDGNSLEDNCTASISIENLGAIHLRRVLAELSEMAVRDLARLGVLSAFKPSDDEADKGIESAIITDCSHGSGLSDAVLCSGVHPLRSHPA